MVKILNKYCVLIVLCICICIFIDTINSIDYTRRVPRQLYKLVTRRNNFYRTKRPSNEKRFCLRIYFERVYACENVPNYRCSVHVQRVYIVYDVRSQSSRKLKSSPCYKTIRKHV